jgi:hypothetical protein
MINNSKDKLQSYLYKLIKEELEDGEDNQTKKYAEYDVVLIPEDINKAIDALSNIKNYGIYAQNLRDSKTIEKIFGNNTPATKGRVAKETWDKYSEVEKRAKVLDIKSRVPEDFKVTETNMQSQFENWSKENEGDFIDFLISLPSDKLPISFLGKYGANFYLIKRPETLAKYSGVMSKGIHYLADENELTFPQNWNPFKSKDYLKKVLKLIMDNAGIQYVFSEQESTEQPKEKAASVTSPDRPDQINFVKSFTNDEDQPDEELAAKFRKLIPDEFKFKTKVENGKVTVSDITAPQKKALINISIKFQEKYSNLYENKTTMKDQLRSQLTSMIKEVLLEKKLTPAKLKKRNKTAEKIKKSNPKMDKGEAFAIATKQLKEGEDNMSMDDIIEKFVQALDIRDDEEANKAIKAVGMALKNKVKGKVNQAADWAKDKLQKYDDSLEEVAPQRPLLPTAQANVAASQITNLSSFAAQVKAQIMQLQAGEKNDYLNTPIFKAIMPYLDKAISNTDKTTSTPAQSTSKTKTTAPNTPPFSK